MIKKEMVTICLNTQDNVAVALSGLAAGTVVKEQGLVCRQQIPAGHKVALRVIHAHEAIR